MLRTLSQTTKEIPVNSEVERKSTSSTVEKERTLPTHQRMRENFPQNKSKNAIFSESLKDEGKRVTLSAEINSDDAISTENTRKGRKT